MYLQCSTYPQDTVMTTDEEKRRTYYFAYKTENPNLAQLEIKLYVLTADRQAPYYIMDEDGMSFSRFSRQLDCLLHTTPGETLDAFSLACVIKGEMSNMAGALVKTETTSGTFWKLNFGVGISFGATELSARLIWKNAQVGVVCLSTSRRRLIGWKI
jgi:hypothetical protein